MNHLLKKTASFKVKGAANLQEIIVVVVIIGILIVSQLDNLIPLISSAKGTEAKLQLQHIHTLQKSFFYINSRFTSDLNEIGYEQEKLVTEGGQANYQISVTDNTSNSFRAIATAVVDFDGDGTFNVWEINQDKELKEVIKD